MNGTDDELELEDVLEDEQPPAQAEVETEQLGGDETPSPTIKPEDVTDLRARIEELAGKDNGIGELVALGKQFLANQGRTAEQPSGPKPEEIAAFGKQLQESLLTGNPEDAFRFFVQAVDQVASNRVNAALQAQGAPVAEKAGQFAVQAFLSAKKDESGTNPALHKAVSKEFTLTPDERRWIATASVDQTEAFLNRKWTEAAGKVLLRSSSRVRPRDLSGGGGRATGGTVTPFPGLDQRAARQQEQLAERLWPDPKVRAEKLKQLRADMEAG